MVAVSLAAVRRGVVDAELREARLERACRCRERGGQGTRGGRQGDRRLIDPLDLRRCRPVERVDGLRAALRLSRLGQARSCTASV